MAKTVKVSIVVDDDGTMRLTERSAKKLGTSLDKVGTSAKRAERGIKGTAQTASASGKNFSKQASVISGGLVPAYAALAATIFATTAAFSFLKSAGDLKVLQEGQIAYTATTGIAMKSLTQDIRKAAQGLLDFETAAQAAAIGVSSGLSAKQITQLAEGAANASKILGRDVTDSFNRLVRGVTKAEPELLDELGIILRLDDASQRYADTLKVNAKSLDQFQKRTAVFNDVQDQLEKKFNRINDILKPENNAFSELGIAFSDVLKGFKELVGAFATPFARFFANNVSSLVAVLGLLAVPLFNQMIPGFAKWGEEAKLAGQKAEEAVAETYKKIEKINRKKSQLVPSTPAQAARNLATEQGLQGRKGSGLERLIQGTEELTKRQIEGMRRAAAAAKGEYKNTSKEFRDSFIKNLDEMKAGAKTTSAAISDDMKRMATKASLSFEVLAAKGDAAFLRIKKSVISVTGALVRFANTLVKIVSIVGILSLAWDLFVAGLGRFGFHIKKLNPELEKLIEKNTSLIAKQTQLNEEYKEFAKVQAVIASDLAGPGAQQFQSAGQAVSSLTENFTELTEAIERGKEAEREQIDTTGSYVLSAMKLSYTLGIAAQAVANFFFQDQKSIDLGKKARKQLITTAQNLNGVLLSTKLTYTGVGLELAKLSTKIANGEDVTKKEIARFLELSKVVADNGQKFAQLIQLREANRSSISQTITGITTYKTSVTDLLDELDKQLKLENDLYSKSKTSAQFEIITRLEKEIKLIKQINDLEIKFANKRLADQFNQNLLLNKAVKISKTRLGLDFKKKTLGTDILELDAKIKLGESEGIKFTQEKLDNLRLQKGVKQEEVKLVEKELELLKEALVTQNQIGKAQNYFNQLRADSSPLNDELLGFEAKRSELTAKRQKAIQDVENINETTSEAERTRLKQIRDGYNIQILLLERDEQVRKDRLALANKLSTVENNYARLLSGRTPMERQRLQILKEQEQNNINILDLQRQRAALTDVADEQKRQSLNNQIEALVIQNELLTEQEQLAFKVADTFRNTLESSLADNLASIIKGTETSFTDAILNMAKTVLESIADILAQSLTEDILGSFGLYNTPASKMKSALEEGGDYIKEKIQEGLGVSGKDTSGSVSTAVTSGAAGTAKGAGETIEETFFSKFTDMFKSILGGLKDIFFNLLSSLGGAGSSVLGGLGSFIGGIFGAASGGIMPGGVTGYANGGIVKRPTLGLVGEGKMNEAVVPLPDGKAIPVSMNGSGQNNNVTVNVSMDGQGKAQEETHSNGQQGLDLGRVIAGAVQEELQRQKRPGGILSPYGAA